MTFIQPSTLRACLFRLVAVACLAVPFAARAAGPATGDCARRAGVFRERLETVTEAAIDGRPAAMPAAVDSADAWWRTHGASFDPHASADSLVAKLVRTGHARHANEAAQLAVRLSTLSFGWCTGALSTADQLMVLDLTGQAAWLGAKGAPTQAPANSLSVSETVASRLQHAQHAELASKLRKAVAAVQPQAGGKPADVHAAVGLLDLVDDIEKVLH
jgi:hypothetical protein